MLTFSFCLEFGVIIWCSNYFNFHKWRCYSTAWFNKMPCCNNLQITFRVPEIVNMHKSAKNRCRHLIIVPVIYHRSSPIIIAKWDNFRQCNTQHWHIAVTQVPTLDHFLTLVISLGFLPCTVQMEINLDLRHNLSSVYEHIMCKVKPVLIN